MRIKRQCLVECLSHGPWLARTEQEDLRLSVRVLLIRVLFEWPTVWSPHGEEIVAPPAGDILTRRNYSRNCANGETIL